MALPSLMTHLSLITLVFHLVLPMTVSSAQAPAPVEQYENETVLRYYIVEIYVGNATVVPVAGIQGEFWSLTTFATIFVADDPLVAEPSPYAPPVGRVRGLVVVASKDGRSNFLTSTNMFSEYNGSTLETHGTIDRASGEPSEIAIVGGTKQFRGAKGVCIVQIIKQTAKYTITQVTYKFSRLV